MRRLPPFVMPVGLFVNAQAQDIDAATARDPAAAAAVPRRRDAGSRAAPRAGRTCVPPGWRRGSIC